MAEFDSRTVFPERALAVALALLGVIPMAAIIKWAPVVTWLPVAWREWGISMALFALICVALSRWAGNWADRSLDRIRAVLDAAAPDEFAAWAALLTLVGSIFTALYCFGGQPAGGDEMTQLFQARILRSGHLAAVAEPNPEFFSGIQTVVVDGRWFSQFPIGGAAALALGLVFRAAWLINPVLAAWTTWNVYRFASGTVGDRTARIATVLFMTSPFVLLMSGSQMNHVGALAFTMFALAALVDWARSADPRVIRRAAFRVGFGFAALATFRPYDAVALAIVVGTFQLIAGRGSREKLMSFAWQLAGGAMPLAALFYINAQTTGHALFFGYDALNAPTHRPGFHVDPMGVDFTPVQGIHHVSSYLLLLNASLLGGPIPSVLLMVAALAFLPRATKWDHLTVALIASVVIAYATYWAESFFVGPRFLYGAVPLFLIVVARLPEAIAARARGPGTLRFARLILPLFLICAWVLPPRIAQYQGGWSALAGTRANTASQAVDLSLLTNNQYIEPALIFIPDSWHGKLAARLRAIGTPALTAESMLHELDACVIHMALDMEDRIPGPPGPARVQRVARQALFAGDAVMTKDVTGSRALAFVPKRMLSNACEAEMQADADAIGFDRFLPLMRFDSEGRLDGNFVFARDLGMRNQLLLGRFGDRAWYRFRPNQTVPGAAPELVPYAQSR